MSAQLRAKLVDAQQQLDDARQRQAEVDFALKYHRKQLDEIQQQDGSIAILARMLADIRQLEQQDSIQLLWGESCTGDEASTKRRRIEISLQDYDTRVSTTQNRIRTLLDEHAGLERHINHLQALQQQLQHELDRLTIEAVKPEPTQAFSSQTILPWSNPRKDAIRLRVIMIAAFATSILLGFLVTRWELPEPERVEFIEIPERLATLIVKKPPPPPPQPEQKQEQETEPAEAEPETTPEQKEQADARKTAETAGLLAFKKDFAEIRDASAGLKMGSQATLLTAKPAKRRTPVSRSLITSPADFSGTRTTSVNVQRTDVIGDSNKLKQVEFSHVENEQVASIDTRQMASSKTATTKRSDEEIQVVFDRYKDALYRIYNRELRKDSFLKGKLVLQLTIEPDGKVSNCKVESSELDSEELEKKIVARVLRFNFGPKKGAKPVTIRYPIDFLPST